MVALAGLTVALSGLTASAGGLSGVLGSLGGVVSGVGSAIMGVIGPAIDYIKDKFKALKDFWNENIMPIWDAFYAVAEPIITLLGTILVEGFGLAFDAIGIAWQLLVDLLSAL